MIYELYKYNELQMYIIIFKRFNFFFNPKRRERIRTRDTLSGYTHFPGVRLQPLGHLSMTHCYQYVASKNKGQKYIFFYRLQNFIASFFCLDWF